MPSASSGDDQPNVVVVVIDALRADHTFGDRLFSFITQNWRGKPLLSREVIVNLIGATTTRTGLEVYAHLDEREYPKGVTVSDAELAAVNLEGAHFHPEWNYTIKPRVDC